MNTHYQVSQLYNYSYTHLGSPIIYSHKKKNSTHSPEELDEGDLVSILLGNPGAHDIGGGSN